MATLMRYRRDGAQPHCEIVLENGDHVQVTLAPGGVVITRLARADRPEQILFLGSTHVVADICLALLNGRPASEASVLDIFLAVVSQFRSAQDIRAAFAEATGGG